MASERAKQMQTANTLAEVLASLERIEIALGIKPKPEEPKTAAAKAAEQSLLQGRAAVLPGQKPGDKALPVPPGEAVLPPRSGMASRQNPPRRQGG